MPPPICVSIVEDHDQLRAGVRAMLNGAPGFHCVGAHRTLREALAVVPHDKPDVLLLDIGLPDGSGIDAARELSTRLPRTKILMLTIEQDSAEVFKALEAGAHGYLVKDVPFPAMLEAIEAVHRGGAPMSPPVARQVIQFFHRRGAAARELDELTAREAEVLRLLSQGFTNKEIARDLGCEPRTVAAHLHHIYDKLHVHSRAGAVAMFFSK
jgi:DNA-binding NarL/FixJ family response regulator